jgi:hypothetical protein
MRRQLAAWIREMNKLAGNVVEMRQEFAGRLSEIEAATVSDGDNGVKLLTPPARRPLS